MTEFKYLFGPVASRRLGLSLGIDVVPPKTCSYDCIYCEVGKTTRKQVRRESFFPAQEIIAELREFLSTRPELDYVTFGGSGEPTLNRDIGLLIREIKRFSGFPVAVLTNGSLLWRQDVQHDLMDADIVIPSLDAGSEEAFRRMNRPARTLRLQRVVHGMADFTRRFAGEIWLEMLFCKGVNDAPEHVEQLANLALAIGAIKVHLTTVLRPPAEAFARPVSKEFLETIRPKFGPNGEVVGPRRSKKYATIRDIEQQILALVRRRPTPVSELALSLGISRADALKILEILHHKGALATITHQGEDFYTLPATTHDARQGGIGGEKREAGD